MKMLVSAQNLQRLITSKEIEGGKSKPKKIEVAKCKNKLFAAYVDSLWNQDGYITKQELQQTSDLLKQAIIKKDGIKIKDLNNNGAIDLEDIRNTHIQIKDTASKAGILIAGGVVAFSFGLLYLTAQSINKANPLAMFNKRATSILAAISGTMSLCYGFGYQGAHEQNMQNSIFPLLEYGKENGIVNKN